MTMINEELARRIQQGERDLILQLWAQVRRYAHDRAYKWYRATGGRGGVTLDDLEQESIVALLEALEGWDEKAGKFPEDAAGQKGPAPGLSLFGCSLD